MSRHVKRLMMDSIQEALSGVRDLFVVDVSRVTAVSVNQIRLELADSGIRLLCVKNAVASRALIDLGLNCASQAFVGPSALVFSDDDIVTTIKQLVKCAGTHKLFNIRSGIVDGRLLSGGDIDIISKSPGKSELMSQLSACILSPGRAIASSLLSYNIVVGQIVAVQRRIGAD